MTICQCFDEWQPGERLSMAKPKSCPSVLWSALFFTVWIKILMSQPIRRTDNIKQRGTDRILDD